MPPCTANDPSRVKAWPANAKPLVVLLLERPNSKLPLGSVTVPVLTKFTVMVDQPLPADLVTVPSLLNVGSLPYQYDTPPSTWKLKVPRLSRWDPSAIRMRLPVKVNVPSLTSVPVANRQSPWAAMPPAASTVPPPPSVPSQVNRPWTVMLSLPCSVPPLVNARLGSANVCAVAGSKSMVLA